MIVEKRKQLLKKLQGWMNRLTHPRAVELARVMHRMLKHSEKDWLTHDHITIRDFEMNNGLVQAWANAQVRTGSDFLSQTDPA